MFHCIRRPIAVVTSSGGPSSGGSKPLGDASLGLLVRFELYVDLPGVDPSKVDLTLEGGILTLSGQRDEVSDPRSNEIQYQRTERSHGHFHRRFVLPDTADSQGVNATGKNGVLTVTIAKHAKAMPRRIQISG
jgi:HSP20 family protein